LSPLDERDELEVVDFTSRVAATERSRPATEPLETDERPATSPLRLPFVKPRSRAWRVQNEIPEAQSDRATLRRDALYRRMLAGADALSAAVVLFLLIPLLPGAEITWMAVLAVPPVVIGSKIAGLYDRDEHLVSKTTLDEAPALLKAATLYVLVLWLGAPIVLEGELGRTQGFACWVLLPTLMLATRAAARRLAGARSVEERCLVLGDPVAAHWLKGKMASTTVVRAHIVGRVALEPASSRSNGVPLLGDFSALGLVLAEHDIHRVIIAPSTSDAEHVLDAIRVVKSLGVKVSVLPRLFEVVGSSVEFDEISGTTLLGVRRHGLTRSSRRLKRILDVALTSVALVLLAPLLALIAVAISLDSPGPVLFRQRRMGRHDRAFEMLKFRTMFVGSDEQKASLMSLNEARGGLFKIENDPRVTRVGRLLRRTSLDELPQLLNVLRGDMALVGPRPLVVEEDKRVQGWQRRRLLLPPGMTGLWQVLGSARIPLPEMVKIDYLYGANWSLWLDIKILMRTIPFVVGRRGL
jgi:exopolysaccharide biosynthesis polyprenyl glycosylphosphotransferase